MFRTRSRRYAYYPGYMLGKKLIYNDYIKNQINPLFWLKLNETSGTSVINYGSIGGTGVWTPGVGALGQIGYFGSNQAYLYDALNSKIQFTNASVTAIANLTNQKGYCLGNFTSIGEASAGFFFGWGTGSNHLLRFLSSNRITSIFDTDATDAAVTSDVNQVSDLINNWRYLFWDYDDSNTLGNGRRIRLFKTTPGNSTITTITFGGGNVAATGTMVVPSTDLVIGNISSQARTLDGKLDEFLITSGLWTTQQIQTISILGAN